MLSTIAEIIRDLLLFAGAIAALLVALVVVVSKMPNTKSRSKKLGFRSKELGWSIVGA